MTGPEQARRAYAAEIKATANIRSHALICVGPQGPFQLHQLAVASGLTQRLLFIRYSR